MAAARRHDVRSLSLADFERLAFFVQRCKRRAAYSRLNLIFFIVQKLQVYCRLGSCNLTWNENNRQYAQVRADARFQTLN